MKKIVSIVIVLICILVIVLLFIPKNDNLSLSTKEISNSKLYKLEIVKHTNTSIDYKIVNNSNDDVNTTAEYYIEKYKNNKWYSYNISVNFNEISQIIKQNDFYENIIDFELQYGNLENGKYRLIVVVNGEYIASEFNIKKS